VTSDPTTARPAAARRTRLSPAERRASILTAATGVFSRVGYQKAKMSEVAAAVGVTEPVVFQNFGTKAGLYVAVLEQAGKLAAESFARRAFHGATARSTLEELLSPEHLEAMHSGEGHGVLFADAMTLTTDPELGAAARRAVGVLADALARLIADGQSAGDFRREPDPVAAAWAVLSIMASYYFRAAVMPEHSRLEQGVSELILRALIEDGPEERRSAKTAPRSQSSR
jgi:AcrR family transcriptional regulator